MFLFFYYLFRSNPHLFFQIKKSQGNASLESLTICPIFVKSYCVLRSSTETDSGDKEGNKTDEISVFLVATDRCVHGGAQPGNKKAENKVWNYVLWWELWHGQRAERGKWLGEGKPRCWAEVRGTLVCGQRCLCSGHISSKTCKGKQLCQESSPDSR